MNLRTKITLPQTFWRSVLYALTRLRVLAWY